MFQDCPNFDQDLSNWNTSSVENMSRMFNGATAFNGSIGAWDVSSVTDMYHMFREASAFDQDIRTWNVSNVLDMEGMFQDASVFNQDLQAWCVTQFSSEPIGFSLGSALTPNNLPVWGDCGYNPSSAYLNSRNCVVCDQFAVGDTFSLDYGTTWFTVVDRPLLQSMRDNGADLNKVCVSLP